MVEKSHQDGDSCQTLGFSSGNQGAKRHEVKPSASLKRKPCGAAKKTGARPIAEEKKGGKRGGGGMGAGEKGTRSVLPLRVGY